MYLYEEDVFITFPMLDVSLVTICRLFKSESKYYSVLVGINGLVFT